MSGRRLPWSAGLWAAWVLWALLAWGGAAAVPFHPDEATYIYMSRDFDLLFLQGQAEAVSWQAMDQPAAVRRYRLLDAPMARYLAGLGRALGGEPPLAQDWNWSAGWAQNAAAGAVPNAQLLSAARVPATVLTALACLLVYGIGRRLGGRASGVTAALLFGLSGLVLLHGRRAMSEGALLFFTALTLWVLLRPRPNAVLAGLALAGAVAAKLTGLSLLPVALVALALPVGAAGWRPMDWRPALRRLVTFGVVCGVSLWALHPALWRAPLAGLPAMQAARQQFLDEQTAVMEAIAPHARLEQPGMRALAMVYHVYFAPPAYADVGQYAAETAADEHAYQAAWPNWGWHTPTLSLNLMVGGLLLGLTLVGLLSSGLRVWARWRQPRTSGEQPAAIETRAWLILAVWTAATFAGLMTIAVPAQRYYLPLLPIAVLWATLGLRAVALPLRGGWQPARQGPLPSHD